MSEPASRQIYMSKQDLKDMARTSSPPKERLRDVLCFDCSRRIIVIVIANDVNKTCALQRSQLPLSCTSDRLTVFPLAELLISR